MEAQSGSLRKNKGVHMALKSMTLPRTFGEGPAQALAFVKELVLLTKPNVLFMNALMTLGGLAMAARIDIALSIKAMIGTALAIAAAGTLNMYLERDTDGLMKRTAGRPLPGKRIAAKTALFFGLITATVSLVVLYFMVNPLTAVLAAVALVVYVCLYTPMKYKSPYALHIGSIAGAMPPLMGWTAATGRIESGGLVLFALLYFWQLPHVVAISIYRNDDYAAAGIRTLPAVLGPVRAARHGFAYTIVLFFAGLLPLLMGMAGILYAVVSVLAYLYFFRWAWLCLRNPAGETPRKMFFASLIYLPVIVAALAASRL